MTYSRTQPSPRYQELVELYQRMHRDGDARNNIAPIDMFPGQSLLRHAGTIKQLIDLFQARTLLDYGSGKGLQYSRGPVDIEGKSWPDVPSCWGLQPQCYDPAYPPYMTLPEGKFDAVICTDVLEHCPESDLDWILDELFGHASRFVYANVASFPASKLLPNGENSHITLRPMQWWMDLFRAAAMRNGDISFLVMVAEPVATADGQKQIKTTAFASPNIKLS